jgi:alkanesulfonate monooxygenase SsuD/methylene tetrahydromethanopterin reductase-like flavin-dependent oxidoreductase (luciferase family)
MRFGIFLPPFDGLSDPGVVAALAAEAEAAGWDGLFVWDHIAYRPPVQALADPWITLTAVAAATQTLRFGPMVTPLPRRRPVVVARATASLDRFSGGRLVLGVGIGGDNSREFSGTGETADAPTRGRMLDESLGVLTAAWTGEPVHHRGEHYLVDGLAFRPVPVQQPRVPVWVAARFGNPAPLRRAARWDGVFPIGMDAPDQLAEVVAAVTSARASAGGTAYDVAAEGAPGTDPQPWAAAGATWWLTSFGIERTQADRIRGVIHDGPPA